MHIQWMVHVSVTIITKPLQLHVNVIFLFVIGPWLCFLQLLNCWSYDFEKQIVPVTLIQTTIQNVSALLALLELAVAQVIFRPSTFFLSDIWNGIN
jgi:hypothetical protein